MSTFRAPKSVFKVSRVSGFPARLAVVLVVLCGAMGVLVAPAFASESPWWQLSSSARPAVLVPGSEGTIVVAALNVGDQALSGLRSPVRIVDTLPAGMTAIGVSGTAGYTLGSETTGNKVGPPSCAVEAAGASVTCLWKGYRGLQPFEQITLYIKVLVEKEVPGAKNLASVSGGEPYLCVDTGSGSYDGPLCSEGEELGGPYEEQFGGTAVPSASLSQPVTVGGGATPFALSNFNVTLENEGGSPDTQAGSHPFQFSTTVAFNESPSEAVGSSPLVPTAFAKNIAVNLPPGLVGNVQNIPQCTEQQFAETAAVNNANRCPDASVVGVAALSLTVNAAGITGPATFAVPVFNLPPSHGEPARFGFEAYKAVVIIDTSVRTGSDYGITATVSNTTQFAIFRGSTISLWGVPGAAAHRYSHGWTCIDGGYWEEYFGKQCPASGEAKPRPLFTAPTSCTGPLKSSAEVTSWLEPERKLSYEPGDFGHQTQSMYGCGQLPFAASVSVAPDVEEASKPSGLNVHIHVPQETSLDTNGLAGADVRDTTVTLPEGVTLNPAGADGLQACDDTEVGYQPGQSGPQGELQFTSKLPEPLSPGTGLGGEGFCPDASKVGTVNIKTPLLEHELEGSVYLASQDENPFGSLVAMYIVAEDPISGVLVKLPGEVSLNPSTGQITSTFLNTPQVPFEDLVVHFFGGDRAPLATPSHCGTFTTEASFAPWSQPPGGTSSEPLTTSSSFEIDSGPNHTACPGAALPFSPALTAGTTNNNAGAFSPFSMTMSREDGQQNLKSIQLHMPPGLSGTLTGIPLCGEAQADAGTCSAASLIGETTVSVGLGSNPYTVTGGKVYLTGPYEGAPFGLSILNPANAGPFHLGNVIVRAKIEVDPITAALTITSDSSGPYAIPPSIKGIPLQIKHVNVTITRAGFTFNPTNCGSQAITGTLQSVEGGSSALSVPFQATNCASLKFQPKFAASTAGKSTRAKGASLSVKLTYPSTPQGTEANIKSVKVDLPKQLPSRLTTLQKACTAKQFEANPAGCPAASIVGHAKALTPILPVPLEGPAYFVSHGGEAFPSLIVVLQGYGVTVDLVGTTFISKAGITSSTFKTVPDVPVGTFELNLPTGKYSALATNLPEKDHGNFCGQKLTMPTAFLAQNGTEIHESTKIAITGCPKAVPAKKAKKVKKAKKSSKQKG